MASYRASPPPVSSPASVRCLLLRHGPTGTPVEVSLAWLPFEREALDRATVEDVAGIAVPVASAEDLIVYKTVAWRDRDRADVERLLVLYGSRVDLDWIRSIIGQVAAVLEKPARLAEFEQSSVGSER